MAPVTSESKQATSDPEAHRLPPTSDLMAETSVVSSSLDEVDDYLAPDGGYGWVIVACILGINIVTYGALVHTFCHMLARNPDNSLITTFVRASLV
jgi:hypothetical protein